MSSILSLLKFTPESNVDGLVRVSEILPDDIPLAEKRIIHETLKISENIDFVFFRRFIKEDVRTSQAVAYIVDNCSRKLHNETLASLHRTLWLNGTVPLLYVDNEEKVDIFSCSAKPVSEKASDWNYQPLDKILLIANEINEKINQYSASRLADGSFWEDEQNNKFMDSKNSAHNVLLEKIKRADKEIDGEINPIARRLLLITLLIKYLEDRGVFKMEKHFFSKYVEKANSFLDVLKNGTVENLNDLLKNLEGKFNGDIFVLNGYGNEQITVEILRKIARIVRADTDNQGQLYFWDIYNFEHIPVEVISHIYQYFTKKKQGAVFTPVLLVNLMLDQVMPLDNIEGNEIIFDPTCGSGIFLVSAFRRLIYINRYKDADWLNPQNIVNLLMNTIFGVEWSEEAANITSFSLALAVCDALQPNIIWRDLRFEKVIDHNIFIGDFGVKGKDALKASESEDGFDIILGNPPFMEELTSEINKDIIKNNRKIPGKQLAYYILETCIEKYLSEFGKICMIQPYGFLYNANVATWRCDFFKKFTVEKLFDFISINELFYDANTKAIAIQAKKLKPVEDNKINHLTFRRTISIKEKICFELDYYDYNKVLQKEAINEKYSWKANLLGGGRLVQLSKRLSELSTIKKYINDKGWINQEGYIVGNQENDGDFLFDQLLLLPVALTKEGIDDKFLGRVQLTKFERPREKNIYESPLMVIEEREALNSGFWNNGFLAYTGEFIGIKVQPNERIELENFYTWFKNDNKILCSCLHLFGGRMLAARSTATQKEDIMNLPYPDSGDFNLVPWERELLNDVSDYMAEYVRKGQNSKLLIKKASEQDLQNYSETFLRLMNKLYPNMKKFKELVDNDFRLVAFSFKEINDALPELNNSDCLKNLSSLIRKEQSDNLRTQRVIQIYTGDTLMIIKPNKLRYWIRSAAIRDVDDVMVYIIKGEK